MLTGGDAKGSSAQDRGVGLVGEGDAVDAHFPRFGKRNRSKNAIFRRVDDLWGFAGEALDFAGCSDSTHADVEELADSIQGVEHDRGEQDKCDGLTDCEPTVTQTPVSKSGRTGNHSQRENAVNHQQDHLVSGEVAHDFAAYVLRGLCKGAAHALSSSDVGQR